MYSTPTGLCNLSALENYIAAVFLVLQDEFDGIDLLVAH
jgi:hypothetical protein